MELWSGLLVSFCPQRVGGVRVEGRFQISAVYPATVLGLYVIKHAATSPKIIPLLQRVSRGPPIRIRLFIRNLTKIGDCNLQANRGAPHAKDKR